MISLLKLGIAVLCLLGAAAFIAVDMYRSTPAPVAAVVPVLPSPAPAPEAAVPPVPPPVKKAAPVVTETLSSGVRVYTVVQGDTLYGISVKVFGTPRHYERIYEANKEKIKDPSTLQIGLKLALPDVPIKAGGGEPVPISITK